MDDFRELMGGQFQDMPPKAEKLLKAVIEMMNEGQDLTVIKVGDITARAGVGKGTAYEYFDTKEEIIVKAMYYYTFIHAARIEAVIMKQQNFHDIIYQMMDYIWENKKDIKAFEYLLRLSGRTSDAFNSFQEEFLNLHIEIPFCDIVDLKVNRIMERGVKEGIFTEERKNFQRHVFWSQVIQYFFFVAEPDAGQKEEIENFIYNGMLLLLSQKK